MRVIQNDNDKSNKLYIPLQVFTSNDFVSTILNNHDLIHTLVGPTFMTPGAGTVDTRDPVPHMYKTLGISTTCPSTGAGFLNHPQYQGLEDEFSF